MTTSKQGGLYVSDMKTSSVLWVLSSNYVRRCAHLEYSNGFIIFDRIGGDKEVWRLMDMKEPKPPNFNRISTPDTTQMQEFQAALNKASSFAPDSDQYSESSSLPLHASTSASRGRFEPYALLHMPDITTAYRFVYPTLLVGAFERIYLWDVPMAKVVEVVEGIQHATIAQNTKYAQVPTGTDETTASEDEYPKGVNLGQMSEEGNFMIADEDNDDHWTDDDDDDDDRTELGDLRYVEHSPSHIFLVGLFVIKVFKRALGSETGPGSSESTVKSSQLELQIPATKVRYGRWMYTLKPYGTKQEETSALAQREYLVSEQEKVRRGEERRLIDRFVSGEHSIRIPVLSATLMPLLTAHVSPCGSHFAALLTGSRLLIVPHFKKLAGKSEAVVYDSILDIRLGSPKTSMSIYLAYEGGDGGEGRIGIVTVSLFFEKSILLFTPHSAPSSRLVVFLS